VIDRALASYAKAIAFKDDPPERTP
jgi:hypothetical protein